MIPTMIFENSSSQCYLCKQKNGDASPAIEKPAAAVESEGQFTTGENPKS